MARSYPGTHRGTDLLYVDAVNRQDPHAAHSYPIFPDLVLKQRMLLTRAFLHF